MAYLQQDFFKIDPMLSPPYLIFFVQSGYFMQFLAKKRDFLAVDPQSHLHPMG